MRGQNNIANPVNTTFELHMLKRLIQPIEIVIDVETDDTAHGLNA